MNSLNRYSTNHWLRAFSPVLSLVAGCATTGGHRSMGATSLPDPHFPTRARLEALAANAPPQRATAVTDRAAIAQWTLEGPLATTLVQRGPATETPWTPVLRQALSANPRAEITEDMQCVARELGRFTAHESHGPAQDLVEFVSARCGSTARQIAFWHSTATVPARETDADLAAFLRDRAAPQLAPMLSHGAPHTGIWVGRDGTRVTMFVAVAEPAVDIEPGPMTPDASGNVTLRGRLLEPNAESLVGLVNQGRSAVAVCTHDPAVSLPAFALTCPIKREDASARIELATTHPGTLLFHPVVQLLAWSAEAPSNVFTRVAPFVAPSSAPDATAQLVGLLNLARADAHLRPLAPAAEQNAAACRLAPILAAASEGTVSPDVANSVTLGLMAGWDVPGLVRDAGFVTYSNFGTRDLGVALANGLQDPISRFALLQPDASIGIACEVDDTSGAPTSLLFGTYTVVDRSRRAADERSVIERLTRARATRGLPPLHSLDGARPAIQQTITALENGGTDAVDGLHEVTEASVSAVSRSINTWAVETLSLDIMEFPPALLTRNDLEVSIGVGYWRPPGRAWAHMVIYFVAAAAEG